MAEGRGLFNARDGTSAWRAAFDQTQATLRDEPAKAAASFESSSQQVAGLASAAAA